VQCDFCGREVKPTVHRREGRPLYQVDYYALVTGKLERTVMQDMFKESGETEFFKLVEPRTVAVCIECFEKEGPAAELERMFSGVPESDTETEPASN
jgi:hypothetical protein